MEPRRIIVCHSSRRLSSNRCRTLVLVLVLVPVLVFVFVAVTGEPTTPRNACPYETTWQIRGRVHGMHGKMFL